VSGFTSRPDVQRPEPQRHLHFRESPLVRDRLILHAIHEAYRNICRPRFSPQRCFF